MVLKSRHIKDLFKPASGMVIELYRNNLFDPMNIGNFASTFAYRNFLKSFFSWSVHGPTGLVRRSPAEIKTTKVNYQ